MEFPKKYLFCNVAWMKHYKGETADDKPLAGGSHPKKFEACNFVKDEENRFVFGYVQPQGTHKQIAVERIAGGSEDADSESGVFVIWTAPSHDENGGSRKERVVVGWYKNATVYRRFKKFGTEEPAPLLHEKNDIAGYWIRANKEDAHLLPIHERFEIPVPKEIDWNGRNLVNYDKKRKGRDFANKVWKIAEGDASHENNKKSLSRTADAERKARVEKSAIDEAEAYYMGKIHDCEVESVEKENKGWDLEVLVNGDVMLRVEVKGLSGSDPNVLLTPNEYTAFKKKLNDYRLVIVTNALATPKLLECYFCNESKSWKVCNSEKASVGIEEKLSAEVKLRL